MNLRFRVLIKSFFKVMNYKNYIQRKIGSLVNKRNNNALKTKHSYTYQGLSSNKEKEIIVYLRNQRDMDKQQLIDFSVKRFNINDRDAESLFYTAYPDGLDLQEDKSLCDLDKMLSTLDCLPKEFIDKIFESLLEKRNVDIKEINPVIVDTTKIIVSSLLHRRNLI